MNRTIEPEDSEYHLSNGLIVTGEVHPFLLNLHRKPELNVSFESMVVDVFFFRKSLQLVVYRQFAKVHTRLLFRREENSINLSKMKPMTDLGSLCFLNSSLPAFLLLRTQRFDSWQVE